MKQWLAKLFFPNRQRVLVMTLYKLELAHREHPELDLDPLIREICFELSGEDDRIKA